MKIRIVLLAVLVSLSILFFSYHLAYARKVIPGVRVAGVVLGNKSQSEAETLLRTAFDDQRSTGVRLEADGKVFEFSFKELGIDYDLSKTVAQAFAVGRSGNLFNDLRTEINTWFNGVELEPVLTIGDQKLALGLSKIAEEVDDPPVDAAFKLEENGLATLPAKGGRVVNQKRLKEQILVSLKSFSAGVINVPIESINPNITAADLEMVEPEVKSILNQPVSLVYQTYSWTPTPSELLAFIRIAKKSGVVLVDVDPEALAEYVARIASQVNREPRGDIFKLEGDRVVEFRLASDGLTLDQEQSLALFSAAILNGGETVELPVRASAPLRSANDYGIVHLLGQGTSNFTGSSQGRINNIKTAAAKLRGILVAPGETFSFNKSLGEVSAATGYDTAWIIKEGRTVLGTGGGVCQVSTTVFRAAFNSGLEISKRTAHAYRVHYYEPPLGFDATVYEPSPDLVFKNDTGSYILIWSYADVPSSTLTFSIYGTSDGRSTKMIGPFVSNETPPPAPLYQEDSSLPKGTTQQIDFAAWGANAVLKREVYRNGTLLHNDIFVSNYKPWQAVFLVGTRE